MLLSYHISVQPLTEAETWVDRNLSVLLIATSCPSFDYGTRCQGKPQSQLHSTKFKAILATNQG